MYKWNTSGPKRPLYYVTIKGANLRRKLRKQNVATLTPAKRALFDLLNTLSEQDKLDMIVNDNDNIGYLTIKQIAKITEEKAKWSSSYKVDYERTFMAALNDRLITNTHG